MHFTTTGTYSSQSEIGVAHITKKRNRVKIYNINEVYLKTGETFEIELFNPSNFKVLAKIEINGNYISESGIVLRPGERIYLERFIDTNNKFVFETYHVDANDKDVEKAIEKNGTVSVEFYPEYHDTYKYYSSPYDFYKADNKVTTSTNFPWAGTTESNAVTSYFYSDSVPVNSSFNVNYEPVKGSIETGRVEKGDSSDQSFKNTIGSFNLIPSTKVSYKILPESTKKISSKDIRNYCSSCGTRIRKSSWNYCPSCGESLD